MTNSRYNRPKSKAKETSRDEISEKIDEIQENIEKVIEIDKMIEETFEKFESFEEQVSTPSVPTGMVFLGEEDKRLLKKFNQHIVKKLGLSRNRSFKV